MELDANSALHFDMNDEAVNAIDAYEKKIADKTAQLADYINLMAVYFASRIMVTMSTWIYRNIILTLGSPGSPKSLPR